MNSTPQWDTDTNRVDFEFETTSATNPWTILKLVRRVKVLSQQVRVVSSFSGNVMMLNR